MSNVARALLCGFVGLVIGTLLGVWAITFIDDRLAAVEVSVIFGGMALGWLAGASAALHRWKI